MSGNKYQGDFDISMLMEHKEKRKGVGFAADDPAVCISD